MSDVPAPAVILHEGPRLVVSVRGALDDTELVRFRRELSMAIGDRRAGSVLIDVAELDVLDSFGSRTICEVAQMARLSGATAVIVGVQPHLALAMARLGIDTGAIPTALDLDDGLDAVDTGKPSGGRPGEPTGARRRGETT